MKREEIQESVSFRFLLTPLLSGAYKDWSLRMPSWTLARSELATDRWCWRPGVSPGIVAGQVGVLQAPGDEID